VHIHWALSYFKGGRAATFTERIIWQEMRTGKMCFASWDEFREEFTVAFCPENEATTAYEAGVGPIFPRQMERRGVYR
jgi:hypothetical protein